MAPTSKEATRGYFSSVSQKLESGLRQLKQRAVLDMESVKTLLAPIKQKGVNMARATREMPLLIKVELGIAAIGFATIAAELIHDFPYAVGLKDSKDFQPLVVPAVIAMFESMIPPVSSVEDGQVPVPTSVSVTPEGTPLSAGVFPSGTAVVVETGEVITVTPAPATATATPFDESPTPKFPELAEFAIDPDVAVPAELGTPAIAVRWGPEGSFTISTKEGTPYTLVSPVGERPIFDTPKGREFFFGLLAKAFGYENADDYLKAVTGGQAKTITLPQLGIQEGPVVLDPAKISIVFEATEVNDPDRIWFLGRLERHARTTGGWIRNFTGKTPEQTTYFKFDALEDGRVVIRIREITPSTYAYDLIGDNFYSCLISQGVYMLAVMTANNGKYPGPPEGFGDGIWTRGTSATIEDKDGLTEKVFYEETFWEFLGVPPHTKYMGPSDFKASK